MWNLLFTWVIIGQVGAAPVSTGSSLSAAFATHDLCVAAAKQHENNLAGQNVSKSIQIAITWNCTPATGPIHKNVGPTTHKRTITVHPPKAANRAAKPPVVIVIPNAVVK